MPEPASTPATVFDEHMSSWTAWQQEPWARVRYAVVAHVLDAQLAELPGPLRILDAGGGNGGDSLRLAGQGHMVTLVDYSAAMLARAGEVAAGHGVTDRVRLVEGDVSALADLGERDFDVVLCHFVVGYVADPAAVVGQVVASARPGGLVSLVSGNPVSEVLARAVRAKDPAGALDMIGAPTFHALAFEHDVHRFDWRAGARALRVAGAGVVGRYGCRCVIDLMNDGDFASDPANFADILRLELAVAGTSPYRDVARAWQLIARRR